MSQEETPTTGKSTGILSKFFSNPLVGIIGSVASIVSLIFAVYIWREGNIAPQLTYLVNPARAVVVRVNQASRLSVSFDNKPIETDITAAQIAIWNQGKQAIKSDGILKPILIQVENNTPILEATVRKTSRDVIQLSLNKDEMQKGRISVSWNILEQGDGGVIQLIYAGTPDANLHVEGVIEGQKEIQGQFSERLKSPEEDYYSRTRPNRSIGFLFLGTGAVLAILVILLAIHTKRHGRFTWTVDWIVVAVPLVFLGFGTYFLLSAQNLGPPFGFQ